MKVCPQCRTKFADDLNFCLQDGTTLQTEEIFGSTAPPTKTWNDKSEQTLLMQEISVIK